MVAHVPAWRRDDGSMAFQTIVTVPLLGLLIFTIVQFALYFHALQIAQMAADQGLDAARVEGITDSAGQARSNAYLAVHAGGVLHDGDAKVRRTAGHVEVGVTGTAEQVVPFLRLPIHVTAVGPVEQVGTR